MTTLMNLSKLTVAQINEALTNQGYLDSGITHATFEGTSEAYGRSFRYVVVYTSSETSEPGSCNVYVTVDPSGAIVADF